MSDALNDEIINVDDIKKRGDYIREKFLDASEVEVKSAKDSIIEHLVKDKDIGLNEISGVDIGYAGTKLDGKLSKRNPYLMELERNVQLMKESSNSIVVFNGDCFTYVPKCRRDELHSYSDQVAYFYSLLKDLANDGKVLALVRGTEEQRILRNHGVDCMKLLQEALGIEGKVCNQMFAKVKFEDDIIGECSAGIRTINWNNSATTGAYIGRKMEERATKRGGADVYLARTTMNYFRKALIGESGENGKENKPIYLISGGGYTPFKGAKTAGAEYNSIKDGELTPSSYWYKISAEPTEDKSGETPYIIRVNPISYNAKNIIFQGTDKVTETIENRLANTLDSILMDVVEAYPDYLREQRDLGRERIREILLENASIAKRNEEIKDYLDFKKEKKENISNNFGVMLNNANTSTDKIDLNNEIIADMEM